MLKRYSISDVTSQNQLKTSVQRQIRTQVLEQYPQLQSDIETLIPKKSPMQLVKCHNHLQFVSLEAQPVFFQIRNGPWIPTLRVLHKYPHMMPKMQVDYGAIRHVLRGSNVMCPGLTSPGGKMDEVAAGTVVQITAESKLFACGIGIMVLSTEEIRQQNHGLCIESLHTLGDGLWRATAK